MYVVADGKANSYLALLAFVIVNSTPGSPGSVALGWPRRARARAWALGLSIVIVITYNHAAPLLFTSPTRH